MSSPFSGIKTLVRWCGVARTGGEALRRHADMVCEALKGCLPRRGLTSEMLLKRREPVPVLIGVGEGLAENVEIGHLGG